MTQTKLLGFFLHILQLFTFLLRPEARAHGSQAEDVEEADQEDEEEAGEDVHSDGGDGECDDGRTHHEENSSLGNSTLKIGSLSFHLNSAALTDCIS